MRGIEGAPLKYIIVGLALVLTISILVTLVSSVKQSTNKTTEVMEKSMEKTAQSMAKELGEMLGEEEKNVVRVIKPNDSSVNLSENPHVEFVIYNFEGKKLITVNITYANASEVIPTWHRFAGGFLQNFTCSWTDSDGDGLTDDFYCKAKNDTPINYHYNNTILKVSIIDSDTGKVISYDTTDVVIES